MKYTSTLNYFLSLKENVHLIKPLAHLGQMLLVSGGGELSILWRFCDFRINKCVDTRDVNKTFCNENKAVALVDAACCCWFSYQLEIR